MVDVTEGQITNEGYKSMENAVSWQHLNDLTSEICFCQIFESCLVILCVMNLVWNYVGIATMAEVAIYMIFVQYP